MSFLKELIFPPVAALILYLIANYVILPLYRQRQRYAQYMPVSLPSGSLPERWLGSWRERLSAVMPSFALTRLRERRFSGLSDEELDPVDALEVLEQRHLPSRPRTFSGEQPRLSRDLEAGFMDDSDDESDRGHH